MLFYFCISSHGLGHASREVSIIRELFILNNNVNIVISTKVNYSYFRLLLGEIPFEYRKCDWDIGLSQINAYVIDFQKTISDLNKLENTIHDLINKEVEWINSKKKNSIIIGDIPPAASLLARKLNVPLILVANFGWDDIYSRFGSDFEYFRKLYNYRYSRADLLLRCPFSLDMNWQIDEHNISFTSNKPRPLPTDFEKEIEQSLGQIVLVAFGGMGFELNPGLYELWPDWTFIIPEVNYQSILKQYKVIPGNLIKLPFNVAFPDILPFVDRFITKPGYSSFCEAISSNTPLHIIPRESFAESDTLIELIPLYSDYIILSMDQLLNGDWLLNKSLSKKRYSYLKTDGSFQAANLILGYIA